MLLNNKPELKDIRKKLRKSLTPAEARLWNCLKSKNLGRKFRRQHSVGDYILDFYCPEIKLAVELDGASHNSSDKFKKDREKDEFLHSVGIKVLRLKSQYVIINLEGVIQEIKKNL